MRKEELSTPFIDKNGNGDSNLIIPNKQKKLNRIYLISCICNVFVNFDHGIIPACTFKLKEELMIDDLFLGVLGSMVFMGLMSGSLVSGYMFTKYQCKKLILFSLAMIAVGIVMFTLAGTNKTLLIVSRLISGFFQVFLVVYYPVWVDYFADNKKTQWLTYLQIGVPFGVFMGYGLTAVLNILEKSYPWISVRNFLKMFV
jgi:MFS family permease